MDGLKVTLSAILLVLVFILLVFAGLISKGEGMKDMLLPWASAIGIAATGLAAYGVFYDYSY